MRRIRILASRIRAVLLVATVGLALVMMADDTAAPPQPVNLRSYDSGSPYSLFIEWDDVTDVGEAGLKNYIVYRDGLEIERSTAPVSLPKYLVPNHPYSFQVVAVDNSNNVSVLSTALVASVQAPAPVSGAKSVKALLVRFPDWPGEPYTTNAVNDLLFNDPFSVKKFFEEVSYGRMTIKGDSEGWYTLPRPASDYCSISNQYGWYLCYGPNNIYQDALSVIPDSSRITTNDFIVMFIHGMGASGINSGNVQWLGAINGFKEYVVAHEIGHGLNFTMHAAAWDVCWPYGVPPDIIHLVGPEAVLGWNACQVFRYGDVYDTMGGGNSMHFNMFIKEKMGFLLPSNIQTVTNDGEYELQCAELPTDGVQMVKIPLPHTSYYFLEYRTPRGFDGPDSPSVSYPPIDGVMIRLRPSNYYGSADHETFCPCVVGYHPNFVINPDSPFVDAYRGLRVEVTQKVGNNAVVRITGLNQTLRLIDCERTGANGKDVSLTFNSVEGGRYSVESSSDLQTWQTLRTDILADGPSTSIIMEGVGTNGCTYLRVGVHPLR
jgi:hypothetical protein